MGACAAGISEQFSQLFEQFSQNALPAERKKVHLRFIVIGHSGAGKSTFLNEVCGKGSEAEEDKPFAQSAGQSACTFAMDKKEFTISHGDREYVLELVDSPGFPDTNPERAARFYDMVVKECNNPTNGILLVAKGARLLPQQIEQSAGLLREFVNLRVPLIFLVNGPESRQRARESDVAFANRRKKDVVCLYQTGLKLVDAAQIVPKDIWVSHNIEELEQFGHIICRIFSMGEKHTSQLKSYGDFVAELQKAQRPGNEMFAKTIALNYHECSLHQKIEARAFAKKRAEVFRSIAGGNFKPQSDEELMFQVLYNTFKNPELPKQMAEESDALICQLDSEIEEVKRMKKELEDCPDAKIRNTKAYKDLQERSRKMEKYLSEKMA